MAICGYHGWHDWYLATNLQNESGLEEHLLPGLEPNGVPRGLAERRSPSASIAWISWRNRHKSRTGGCEDGGAAHQPPDPGFLEGVRELCTRRGIVLIFDECTSGFRETFGGLHLKYGVNPTWRCSARP